MDNHDQEVHVTRSTCDRKCVNGARPEAQKSRTQVQTTSRKFLKPRKGPITKKADKEGPIRHLKQGVSTRAQKEHSKKNTIQL